MLLSSSTYPLRILLYLGVAALSAGCQSTPARSPCADFDCSGRGTCVVAELGGEQVPTCLCDPGYAPTTSGWLCVPATDSSLCAGITCSGKGTCVSVKGQPSCVCDTGYSRSADGKKCVDPCASVTCSGHGTCKATAAGPLCDCDKGYRVSLDGKGCEPGDAPKLQLAYKATYAQHPGWQLGRISLIVSATGEVQERMSFDVSFDWGGGRGFSRKMNQTWVLDGTGDEPVSFSYHDHIRQGKVTRRRWGQASLGPSSIAVTFQRLDKLISLTAPFSGARRPVPMPGGFEYPGWTFGCFSPSYYAMALRRYDKTKKDPQFLEVYYPTSASVGQVRMEVGSGAAPQKPVLSFPDYQIRVIYAADGYPESMIMEQEGLAWSRYSGAEADLNISDLPSATPYTAVALPGAGTESSLAITTKDGLQLAGVLTVPKSATGPVPAVLMVSDASSYSADAPLFGLPQPLYKHLAAHLAAAGVASLRYAARGRGKSQGNLEKATLSQLTGDAAQALAALQGQKSVAPTKIVLLSHGTGSMVALSLLEQPAAKVKAYLGLAPVLEDMDKVAVYKRLEHLKQSGFSSKFLKQQEKYTLDPLKAIKDGTYEESSFHGLPVGLWKDMLAFDGKKNLGAFAGPALVLWGDQDLDFPDPLQAAKDAAAKAGKTNLTATKLAGLTSMFVKGESKGLLEEALLPLELSTAALDAVTNWLAAIK
jgi:pimeloyl-ACP methyl ester carboxylesterase